MASAIGMVNSFALCQCLAKAATSSPKTGAASASAAANIVSFFMEPPGYNRIVMTRRELGKLAAAGSAALLPAARASAQTKYAGALEGFDDKIDSGSFDPVLYTRKLY